MCILKFYLLTGETVFKYKSERKKQVCKISILILTVNKHKCPLTAVFIYVCCDVAFSFYLESSGIFFLLRWFWFWFYFESSTFSQRDFGKKPNSKMASAHHEHKQENIKFLHFNAFYILRVTS